MSNILKNPCNIYTLGWCLYYLQGTLYSYGSIVGKLILAALLLYSALFFVKNIALYNTTYFKILIFIILLFVVYTGFRFTSSEVFIHNGVVRRPFDMLKNICISMFPIFCYYGFARKGYLTESWFKYGSLALLFLSIFSFFWEQSYRLSLAVAEGSSREEFTNNTGYLFAAIIPLLALATTAKTWYKYVLLIVNLLFVLFSMKRGAILVSTIATIIFVGSELRRAKGSKKASRFIFAVAAVVVLYFGVTYLLQNSEYFNHRVQQTVEGDSSNRDVMYADMMHYFANESSLSRLLFGNGIDGTGLIFGNGAHNDWIELAIDMGVLGLIVYLVYWFCCYFTWRSSRGLGPVCTALGIIFLSEFLKSFFSFSINDMPIQEMPALGYCLAAIEIHKYQYKRGYENNNHR